MEIFFICYSSSLYRNLKYSNNREKVKMFFKEMLKSVSACTARTGFLPGSIQLNSLKRTTPKLMDEKRALLDEDYSCEGKTIDFYEDLKLDYSCFNTSRMNGSQQAE